MKRLKLLFALQMLPFLAATMDMDNENQIEKISQNSDSWSNSYEENTSSDSQDITPSDRNIITAVQQGLAEVLVIFLEGGKSPDICDENGNTLLIIAVKGGFEDCVKILLEARANRRLCNNDGDSPFRLAVAKNNKPCFNLLYDGKESYQNLRSATLFWQENVKTLLEEGTTIDCFDLAKKAIKMCKDDEGESLFRFNWHDQQATKLHKEKKTHCGTTAEALWCCFTGHRMGDDPSTVYVDGKYQKLPEECIYRGDFDHFMRQDENEQFEEPLFEQIFGDPKNNEHCLFYVDIYEGMHVFIIEKKFPQGYRIYESWLKHFTLAEWLGVDKFHAKKETFSYDHQGKGQWVDANIIGEKLDFLYKKGRQRKLIDYRFKDRCELYVVKFNL